MIDKNLDDDVSEWTAEELRETFAHAAESSDWNDPAMEVYDDYDAAKTDPKSPPQPS